MTLPAFSMARRMASPSRATHASLASLYPRPVTSRALGPISSAALAAHSWPTLISIKENRDPVKAVDVFEVGLRLLMQALTPAVMLTATTPLVLAQ